MAFTIAGRSAALLALLFGRAEADAGGFCCWAATDAEDFCGTCLPLAVAGPTSYCSKSRAACGACGAGQWCEQAAEEVATGTELTITFDATRAPEAGETMEIRVGGESYIVTVLDSSFEAYPTPAPAPPVLSPLADESLIVGAIKPNVDAVKQHGRLRVVGNKIVGQHGQPVRLRGMSMFWSQWMGRFWNQDTIRWLKTDWHVSFIRAAMGVEQDGYLQNPHAEKAKLQAVVDACIEEGIYVVIDWHDYHAEEHVEEAKSFFSEMAQMYGDTINVLFETYNEPQQISWPDQIKPYHEQIIPVIREHSNNIIILGTRTWSQEVDIASEDPVVGENLAYTIHFYAASMGADLRSKVSTALANGVAVFATEWGTCEYTGDGSVDIGETEAWLAFMEENHISDANWGLSDKEESCSALRSGASGSGGWPDSDLTESGAFVRQSIREYNSDEPLVQPGGDLTQILMKKHTMMRGPVRAAGARRPRRTLGVSAASVAAALMFAAAVIVARRRRGAVSEFLAVDRSPAKQPLDIPCGSDAPAQGH